MNLKSPFALLFVGVTFLSVTTLAGMAEARGGGFSRSSAASGGSFSSQATSQRAGQPAIQQTGTAQWSTQQDARQERASQRQEQRQDVTGGRRGNRVEDREGRQDLAGDEYYGNWDDHWHDGDDNAAALVVDDAGAPALQSTYVTTLPCSGATVVVDDVPYYQCGSTWYGSGYMSGTIVYTVTSPPPGYR